MPSKITMRYESKDLVMPRMLGAAPFERTPTSFEFAPAATASAITRVASARQLLAAPLGRYVELVSCVVWVDSPQLLGVIHTSSFTAADRDELTILFEILASTRLAPRYCVLHDLSALDTVDEVAFAFLDEQLRQWIGEVERRVERLAVVRPGGFPGAAVTGMFEHWIRPRVDARLCDTRSDAYAFLGLDAAPVARARIEPVYARCARPPILHRLREVIERDLRGATLASVAAAMGTSTRTLQRELGGIGTSFRRELSLARVELARRLLLSSDDKLEAVAAAVGMRTAAAFSVMFAELTGEAPSVFRDRNRRARGRRG
jgi:AraC-like DNA-binding protein